MSNNSNQRAVILYLAIVITSIMLAIALGISTILFGQIKTIKEMGFSVKAFYFADSAIEYVLYGTFKREISFEEWTISCSEANPCDYPDSVNKEAEIIVLESGGDYQIQSYGEYQGVKRAIEIGF